MDLALTPTLRVLAAALMLVALLLPRAEARAGVTVGAGASSGSHAYAPDFLGEEGGSCGESEEPEAVQVDCGAQREASFGEPILVSLMRKLGVEMDRETCEELLQDIYAELSCEGRGPECGQLSSGMPPGPGPKLAAGSGSAQQSVFFMELGAGACSGLRDRGVRAPSSRDLQPPVPPPR